MSGLTPLGHHLATLPLEPVWSELHTSYTRQTHVRHTSYTRQTHIIHTSYTHHTRQTHIIHTSYTSDTHHTHIIHTLYTRQTHIIHTSYTSYTRHTRMRTYIHGNRFLQICIHNRCVRVHSTHIPPGYWQGSGIRGSVSVPGARAHHNRHPQVHSHWSHLS